MWQRRHGAPVGPVLATVAHIDFPTNFVIKSHRSGAGHTCQNKYTPGAIACRSGPRYIFLLFCHQFPPFWCWLCDNISTYTVYKTLLVRYWLQLPRHIKNFSNVTDCPIILSPIPTILVLVMWQKKKKKIKHTGCQGLPVRYGVRLPLQICKFIICRQFPPVRCWSCDSSSKHSLVLATVTLSQIFLLSPIPTAGHVTTF